MTVTYVVEMETEKGRLLWGPFQQATAAAEWALQKLSMIDRGGTPQVPLAWVVRPVREPER